MILVGDIGGTKTSLAIFKNNTLKIIKQEVYQSNQYKSFEDILLDFLAQNTFKIDKACFGVAGLVIENKAKITNLSWKIKASKIQKKFRIKKVKLLNDLEATAYGMLYLKEKDFFLLNKGKNTKGNIAVIAAGTGLGEAILNLENKQFYPLSTEGGHCDFAPMNPLQDEFLVWLRKKYISHVSYERILSGEGILNIYEFLLERGITPAISLENASNKDEKIKLISKFAKNKDDNLAIKTMEMFFEIYAAEASNLALKSLCFGGLYIAGGIALKNLEILENSNFLDSFYAKGRFESLMKNIPIKVSKNKDTALIGAVKFAFEKL
ncbi:glucokinase [Halarcobacter mediterraneus]|uniref:Glucokinase n=1 Tax=Halarcobacter mediterraneus TaxID=2023153 RepID=A0A4Q1B578_9BACT|nr:glucokinase [Halarcobacter mediterraneus]RXK13437.1 glucokinase [Halarcobacter mediterraneus]